MPKIWKAAFRICKIFFNHMWFSRCCSIGGCRMTFFFKPLYFKYTFKNLRTVLGCRELQTPLQNKKKQRWARDQCPLGNSRDCFPGDEIASEGEDSALRPVPPEPGEWMPRKGLPVVQRSPGILRGCCWFRWQSFMNTEICLVTEAMFKMWARHSTLDLSYVSFPVSAVPWWWRLAILLSPGTHSRICLACRPEFSWALALHKCCYMENPQDVPAAPHPVLLIAAAGSPATFLLPESLLGATGCLSFSSAGWGTSHWPCHLVAVPLLSKITTDLFVLPTWNG